MTVWPSLSATAFGRFWGRLFAIEVGFPIFGVPLTIGRLMALASIPFMLALYFLMRLAAVSRCYHRHQESLVLGLSADESARGG